MISYKDRGYCSYSSLAAGDALRCVNTECGRCITDEDRESAERLNLPFALSPFRTEHCGYRAAEPA